MPAQTSSGVMSRSSMALKEVAEQAAEHLLERALPPAALVAALSRSCDFFRVEHFHVHDHCLH
jgi:hypothetical protein